MTRLSRNGERRIRRSQNGLSSGRGDKTRGACTGSSTTVGRSGGTVNDTGSARDPRGRSRKNGCASNDRGGIDDTSGSRDDASLTAVISSFVVVMGSRLASSNRARRSRGATDDTRNTRHPDSRSGKNGCASYDRGGVDDASGSRDDSSLTAVISSSVVDACRRISVVGAVGVKSACGSTITWISRGADGEGRSSLTGTVLTRTSERVVETTSTTSN